MGMFSSSDMTAYQPKFAAREPVKEVPPAVIVLPWPPSLNHLYFIRACGRPGKQFIQKGPTTEAKEYMISVRRILAMSGQRIESGPIKAVMTLYRPRRVGDIDNYTKIIFDSVTGVGWEDDSQVIELHIYRRDDKVNPRVELLFERAKEDAPLFGGGT